MEQARSLCWRLVEAKLGGHHGAERRDLDGVLEDVLAEGGTVAQASKNPDDLGVQVMDVAVEGGLLTRLLDALVDETLSLSVELLDTCRMNAAVGDEVLEGDARRLAAYRIEAREHDGLRRIIDDEGDTRHLLEGTDVATLSTNDATLEVIGGDVHRCDGDLARLV